MIQPGLVSVTFRKLTPEEIVALASKAGLQGVEWGGDIHVPHGDIERARHVCRLTEEAGLKVAAYGSYYEVGCEQEQGIPFEQVLATAVELHAPTIRVWAGNLASTAADDAWRQSVAEQSHRIAALAEPAGITISYEYHGYSLTDSLESARRLIVDANHKNIRCYWQPPSKLGFDEQMAGLAGILRWLSNLHVYHYEGESQVALRDGLEHWNQFLNVVSNISGDRYAMLEFVRNESREQLLEDADALCQLCAAANRRIGKEII